MMMKFLKGNHEINLKFFISSTPIRSHIFIKMVWKTRNLFINKIVCFLKLRTSLKDKFFTKIIKEKFFNR